MAVFYMGVPDSSPEILSEKEMMIISRVLWKGQRNNRQEDQDFIFRTPSGLAAFLPGIYSSIIFENRVYYDC